MKQPKKALNNSVPKDSRYDKQRHKLGTSTTLNLETKKKLCDDAMRKGTTVSKLMRQIIEGFYS